MNEPKKQIYELIPKVMEDVGSIGKEQNNKFQNYQFRGIDDALNHIGPILRKHKITPMYVETFHSFDNPGTGKDEKGKSRFHAVVKSRMDLFAPDGSRVTHEAYGEALDTNGDKATNKARAAALKYILFFGLMVPVEAEAVDDSDRDNKTDNYNQSSAPPQQQNRPQGQRQPPPNQQRQQGRAPQQQGQQRPPQNQNQQGRPNSAPPQQQSRPPQQNQQARR